MIRLLVLTHNTKLSGAERALCRILELFDRGRFHVHVALPDEGPLFDRLRTMDGTEVHVVKAPSALTQLNKGHTAHQLGGWLVAPAHLLSLVIRLNRLITREGVDLVLCSSMKADFYGAAAAWLARRPCVWYIHDHVDEHHFPGWLRRTVGLWGRRLPVCVLTNSEASLNALVRVGIPRHRLRVAYYPPLAGSASSETNIRRELGLAANVQLVTLVGRIAQQKGQREFVQAAARLVDRFPDVRFLLVGDSLFGRPDETYKDELVRLLDQPGPKGHMRWLGARSDAVAIQGQSDVAVMNSLWPEGFGLVAAEAMWAGVPLIGTALGGTAELLIHDQTGLVVEPGNIDQLAEAIATLLQHPERGRHLAAAARRHVANIQSDANVRHLEDILQASCCPATG